VEERLKGVARTDPLVVDIGGGTGHDIFAFKKKFPDFPGMLIIQDLQVVVSTIEHLPEGIAAQAHDFLTPQQVKGARVYYLRQILHDWPDASALLILQNIRSAMTHDSVLLLHEADVPEQGVPLGLASLDLSMMAMFAGMERTKRQFEELLDAAGLKLVATWKSELRTDWDLSTVFEAVLKD